MFFGNKITYDTGGTVKFGVIPCFLIGLSVHGDTCLLVQPFLVWAFWPCHSANVKLRGHPAKLHKDYRIRHRADAK
ncbi:hypothetical protein GE253_15965 [Niveispirillum sp. SYP-B3756]|uniref:hypothetical protein n=1 Tax=Niveispirillum sp. SYP-B3756 TaxID=2662178 RepID=UPI001291F264|nr:hypothetical protein [Niveispirillum sp. SYP-B3756]MQP66830.1 hypothetical protein [Niveispirillum sp. SYP-B3756]